MGLIAKFKNSFKSWAEGSPPIDDKMIQTINDEVWVLLYISCIFLDLREKHWVVSVLAMMASSLASFVYLFLFSVVTYIQKDDFIEASHSLHMASLHVITLSAFFFFNYHRKTHIEFIRAWSRNFFDYGDDFEIPEMEEEKRTSRRTKTMIFVALPAYFTMTGICAVSGRAMDEYFGVAPNETYVNGVYMLTPMPMWYPFKVDTMFMHVLATGSFAIAAFAVAMSIGGADAVIIFFNQAIVLQLKTMTHRLRKIEQCAYRLYRKNGGKKLSKSCMFEDSDFLKCYNSCLEKIAQHHTVIIENLDRIQKILRWPVGVAVVVGSIVIAMSLFAVSLGGGRPSILSLAGMLTIAEILNMAMICMMGEQVLQVGEALHEELYDLNWIEVDMPAKRSMMIMIERTKKPLLLLGGVAPLNWQTFSTIMNTAYSYLNLLIASRGN